jgi:membrane-associated phospholipid phosphatase
VAWAVLTPYAKYYDAPWLYGLAALTNAGRVIGRAHWVSDTVAGAALGYYTGDWFYRHSSAGTDSAAPRLWISPQGIYFKTSFQ